MLVTELDIISILKEIVSPGEEKNLIESGGLISIYVLDREIDLVIKIKNPSLQARDKVKSMIEKAISDKFLDFNLKLDIRSRNRSIFQVNETLRDGKILKISNIIAIASGKGGVGKSTVAANLAVTLHKMGFKVGVLDADIYGPSLHIMFDVVHEKPIAVKVDGKFKMKPIENYGVKLISIGFFANADEAVIWRGPMASKALNQMIFDVDWGELDILLIDLPPGTGDIHISILQLLSVTGAVIVGTPQHIALSDVKKGVALFNQKDIKVPILGLIENMSYFIPDEFPEKKYYIFGENGVKHLSMDLKVPFLGEVPLIQSIREACDFGRPVALQDGTRQQLAFREVTMRMLEELSKRNENLPSTNFVKITNMSGCSNK